MTQLFDHLRSQTPLNRQVLTLLATAALLALALSPQTAGSSLAASNRLASMPLRFNAHGRHVRRFVVRGRGAKAYVATTAPVGPRPVRRLDTGQALPVNPTAVFFTAQPGTGEPADQPYTYGSDYSLSSAGATGSYNYNGGGGAITSADFLGDGRSETVSAERCNGPDICLMLRYADGSYSSWWDSGLTLDQVDGDAAERIVLTSADFSGTGSPQVAMAYETYDYTVNLATFSVDAAAGQTQPFTQTGITSVGQLLMNYGDNNIRQSFAITSGDFGGNGMQEVAVALEDALPIYPSYSQTQVSIYTVQGGQLTGEGGFVDATNAYTVSMAAGNVIRGPDATAGQDIVLASGYPTYQEVSAFSLTESNNSFSEYREVTLETNSTGQYKVDLTDANIQVATGDLQGDGSDEIVVAQTGDETQGTNGDYNAVELLTIGSDPSSSQLYQIKSTAVCCAMGPNYSGQFSLGVSDTQPIDPNAQFSSISPQIVLAMDDTSSADYDCPYLDCLEVVTYPSNLQGPGYPWGQDNLQYFPLANQDESTYLPQNDEAARTAFALTDPTGDSLTLGPPRQYIAGGTNVPLVILRAPPVHFDQFGNQSYDVNNCFGSNLGTCGFSSSFSDSQQTTFSTDVTQTDSWEASATVSGGISYAGFDVEASLQGRYGNNFSHDSTSSVNTQVTVQVNANVDDYVFYRKTDYVVEEYPIYGAGNTSGQPNAYVAVITGVNTTYNFENTGPGASDAPMMDTIHQTGNLLSYPYYNPAGQAEPSNSIDDNPEVASSSSGNPVVSTPFPSISFGETGSASGQDSFANQTGQTISNTQTDGYTLTASVGYEQEGVPVKAKVEGSYQYDQSNFQSQSSSFGTTMQINWNTGNLNKSIPGTNYTVMPYLYWNRSGALVLDWEVQLPTSNSGVPTFWEQMYGHQSNPALNLPDLLDAAKGYAAPVGGLQFHDPEMVLTPAAPVPGTTLSVTTPIHNYSLMNEVGWPGVRYYLGDPAQGGYYIGTGTSGCYGTGDCLPSQYTALSGVHWQVPGGLGGRDIRIYASVDPGHAIPEVHYTDNTGWGFTHVYGYLRPTDDVSISGSDISSSAVNPAPGSTVTLRATVHGGAVASGPVQVRFWNGNPATNGGLITTTSVQSIPAGGTSTTPPVQWTVPNRPGQYSIYAQILPANDYDPNMANNTAGTTLTSPSLFVANTPNNTISSYPVGATGNVAPMAWIVGPATGLSGPRGLAVDTYGNLYVANQNSNSITEYAEGSNGNAAPIAVISGSATKLSQPEGLTMDGSGDIFVANQGNSSITEYLPGSHGNVAPKAIISGTSTGLSQPQGLTMGGNGDLLVANRAANTVTEYAPGASGNASPAATLGGAATALKLPQGVLFDAAGDLRVSNAGSNAVTIYAPGSKGNTAPLSTISGTSTGLSTPGGMDVNGSGQVAVPNAGAGSVTLFAAGATGNTMPAGTIVGSKTRLYHPSFVAFTPPPAAITGVATGITTTEAKLTGIETPDGSATRWFFQYRRKGVSTWSHTPAVYGGSGGFRVRVQSVVKSLQASTAYQFRLIAVNPGGEATGAVVSFTTK